MPITNGQCPAITPPNLDIIREGEAGEYFTRSSDGGLASHIRVRTTDLEKGPVPPSSPVSSRSSTSGNSDNVLGNVQKSEELHPVSEGAPKTKVPLHVRTALRLRSVRWRGVTAIIAGVFAQSLSWGLIMTYGTVLAFYVRYLIPGVNQTLVVLAGAIPPFCLLAFALPWGRLLDAGHQRVLNIVAGFFLTGGMVSLAFTGDDDYNSGNYWAILLASIPMGIGQSIYFIAAPQMAKTWHPNHKGLAMGITNSGAAIGGAVWPLIFDTLVECHGFRVGVACLAGISAALSIFIAVFAAPAPDFKRNAIGDARQFRNWWPTRAFKSKVFVTHVISMSFIYFGVLAIPFFVEVWARRSGHISVSEDVKTGTGVNLEQSSQLAVYLLVTLNACQLPGRLLGSTMCDKFRARKIHAIACFVAVIVIGSCWFTVSTFEGGLVFVALFGLTLGVMVSLPINDVQEILWNKRTHLLGQHAGAVYTCCCPFMLGGAVIAGAMVQYFNVWVAPGAWSMSCFFLGGCGLVVGLCIKDDTACFELPESDEGTGEGESERKSSYGGSTRVNSEADHTGNKNSISEKIEPGDVCRRASDVSPRSRLESLRRDLDWTRPESPV
ncbi:hypothetical protein OHC33_007325 [Knufia fluminis]|uniref:Uncharacterized protein n=1 Tax=Knufia fluminis TaxID=191047 RepID=A0AAN8EQ79_9EURO|nr:hypothetical protein OHC33_007325 [Knufia fluminis]